MINVTVKCFATLSMEDTCDMRGSTSVALADGNNVGHLVDAIGVNRKEIKLVFVNSRHREMETMLADGDTVALAPAVGGM